MQFDGVSHDQPANLAVGYRVSAIVLQAGSAPIRLSGRLIGAECSRTISPSVIARRCFGRTHRLLIEQLAGVAGQCPFGLELGDALRVAASSSASALGRLRGPGVINAWHFNPQ